MQPNRIRAEKSTNFGFCRNYTLASYVPKKARAGMLLSSMHHDKTTTGDDRMPDIIAYFTTIPRRAEWTIWTSLPQLTPTNESPVAIVVLQHRRRLLHCCTCN